MKLEKKQSNRIYKRIQRNKSNKQSQQIRNTTAGITLIALVITIIILIILAGITINFIVGDNGIIRRSQEASFKAKMSSIAEQWELYLLSKEMETRQVVDRNVIYAGSILEDIVRDEEIDLNGQTIQNIRTLLGSVGSKEETYVMIYQGELYYVSQPNIPNNKNQTKWCQEIGIKIWEYEPPTGIKVVNGNYEKVNGVWMCTPKLNVGFVKEKTRYVKQDNNGNLVPGTWINKKPEDDWYDYKNQKWANLYVESSGIESYYVWIPRYVYKIDTEKSVTGNERMDVKFVDLNNSYKDEITDEVTTWETLQSQGYQVPEAFYFGDSDNYLENTPIPGYWMSKYQLSELSDTDTYTIDFSTVATSTAITIQNITVYAEGIEASGRQIAEYQYAINGNIVHRSTDGSDFTITGLSKGNKAINVTIVDANGEIIGSMTKLYETANNNPPDLTGFDPDTTFYVYWDEKGIEHNEIPISKPAPEDWYDYGIQNWANIVTRNNGLETYLVWIPRYQYALDSVSQRSYVKFIQGTSRQTDGGYQIPEAFWWDKNDNGEEEEGEQLTGYWITKYQLSIEEETPNIDAEMSAGSSLIHIQNITGTLITEGLKYEYYQNGNKVHEGTDPNENYIYDGLTQNTTYTINIIARNATTNEYVGAITKKIKTKEPYAPDLTGFNKDETFYVYWDKDGNEVRKSIKEPAPKEWYDYSTKKWANIVTTANETQSYFVWIPRYEYQILGDRDNMSTQNRRIDVSFITTDITNDNCTPNYQVPEAFTWGDNGEIQLKGYWISKYQLSEN